MQYLDEVEVLLIHELLLAEFGGMRGITEAGYGRLASAVAAPRQSMFGADLYPDLLSKAAALALALNRNHPFSDGNKRVGLLALLELLERNGMSLTADPDQAYAMARALAEGAPQDWLYDWITRYTAALDAPAPPAADVQYLTIGDLVDIRDALAYYDPWRFEITNAAGLLSALSTPFQSVFGQDSFPTLIDKAGAFLCLLIRNHPFRDGNKRIAFAAVRLFLQRNGIELFASEEELQRFALQILDLGLHDPQIAAWFSQYTRPLAAASTT